MRVIWHFLPQYNHSRGDTGRGKVLINHQHEFDSITALAVQQQSLFGWKHRREDECDEAADSEELLAAIFAGWFTNTREKDGSDWGYVGSLHSRVVMNQFSSASTLDCGSHLFWVPVIETVAPHSGTYSDVGGLTLCSSVDVGQTSRKSALFLFFRFVPLIDTSHPLYLDFLSYFDSKSSTGVLQSHTVNCQSTNSSSANCCWNQNVLFLPFDFCTLFNKQDATAFPLFQSLWAVLHLSWICLCTGLKWMKRIPISEKKKIFPKCWTSVKPWPQFPHARCCFM